MLKKLIILLVSLSMTVKVSAQVKEYPYVIVRNGADSVVVSDSLFYEISRKVVFPVNKYEIPKNSSFRHELLDEILPYFNDANYHPQNVIVRGAASPEGPYEWNKFLAEHRLESLLELISSHSKMPPFSSVDSVLVPEDYSYLLRLMKQKNDKDYDKVAAIVNNFKDDPLTLKAELKRLDGKKVWNRLLKQYFPEMRAARIVLIFERNGMAPNADLTITIKPYTDYSTPVTVPGVQPVTVPMSLAAKLPRRELLSVKTNLLFDFAYMPFGYNRFCPIPNIAIEYYPLHGHFTYGASFDCPWWQNYDDHKYFQVRNYQVEARYYLKTGDVTEVGYGNGAAFKGWYAQAYAHLGLFGICMDADHGYVGEGVGAGLGVGYVLPLTKTGHWRLEFGAQVGYFWSKYDPYQYGDPTDASNKDNLYYYKWKQSADLFRKRQYRFTWLGPTRIGVTLTYDLLYRKRLKKGISLNSWEKLY